MRPRGPGNEDGEERNVAQRSLRFVSDSIEVANLLPRAFEERCEGQLRPW